MLVLVLGSVLIRVLRMLLCKIDFGYLSISFYMFLKMLLMWFFGIFIVKLCEIVKCSILDMVNILIISGISDILFSRLG